MIAGIISKAPLSLSGAFCCLPALMYRLLMDPRFRIVTQIPLSELWCSDGSTIGRRIRMVGVNEVLDLIEKSEVEFVVADIGKGLHWIKTEDHYDFWKNEAKPHFAEPNTRIDLTSFPDAYCYLVSLWEGNVVLLERHH